MIKSHKINKFRKDNYKKGIMSIFPIQNKPLKESVLIQWLILMYMKFLYLYQKLYNLISLLMKHGESRISTKIAIKQTSAKT